MGTNEGGDLRNIADTQIPSTEGIRLVVSAGQSKDRLNTLGIIHLKESYISYGCDRQLHFAHPRID